MKKIILFLFLIIVFSNSVLAAVGCDLNDPDRDVKRFFPNSTNYKTGYYSIKNIGGKELFDIVQDRYGEKFRGRYEKIDIPYTIYTILATKEVIGYIHGVNQKGKYGGLQVFLIFDANGVITNQYFQKMTGKYAKKFRDKKFSRQFAGLRLKDFSEYDIKTGTVTTESPIYDIKNPDPKAKRDFLATLSGIKKNLILMDVFILDPYEKEEEEEEGDK